ncbi:MAG: threonine aldolase family protein [Anaeroplasmataceae bacterium]
MYSFKNDYSTICAKEILDALTKYNDRQFLGYAYDCITDKAINLMKEKFNYNNCDIHFLVGGTQTNMVLISSVLKSYECVLAAESAHICVHETGAIEGTGNKILICDSDNGKITVEGIIKQCQKHSSVHMVKPKLVFISNSTEFGTIYTKQELIEIYNICKKLDLYLYLDGARLSQALASKENDITLNDLCNYTDFFYIGGTKVGAPLGEALVIVNDIIKDDFRFHVKHKGALLAKGFLQGIIFYTLFKDDLYLKLAKHSNDACMYIKTEMDKLHFDFLHKSSTNLLFVYIPNKILADLKESYEFDIVDELEETTLVRIVTSYSTDMEECINFINNIKSLLAKN